MGADAQAIPTTNPAAARPARNIRTARGLSGQRGRCPSSQRLLQRVDGKLEAEAVAELERVGHGLRRRRHAHGDAVRIALLHPSGGAGVGEVMDLERGMVEPCWMDAPRR
jgi:hypothetical protein